MSYPIVAFNPADRNPQSFEFEGREFRTVLDEDGDVLFAASDGCRELGLTNVGQALSRLDDDEKRVIISSDLTGRQQKI